ncbi:ABC transporter substrate-binding protein [Aquihabitans sp. G128]|uniref:ABC transporter substrate-binding protein n=1 Tax=Aquihabitans sp. G128 TaxID=2849779 RepID=UPI001C22BC2B|nr:ABC transporter substrate-binding protein [Aquihabitans sp. G128]QXC60019.1 ABC transporter substrate-binding protein [Aquihabitans sp. G128]
MPTGPAARRPRWRGAAVAVTGLFLAAGLAACGGGGDEGGVPTLNWYVYNEPSGAFTDAASACNEAADGKYRIKAVNLPNNADEQREQLVRRLAAKDSSIDIIGMDVIWTAEFAEAGWIKPIPKAEADQVTKGRLAPAVKTATYKDRLYAAPFNSNAEMLWYRADVTKEPPATWGEMISEAAKLRAAGKPDMMLGQGQRYEGLVVWFTSLLESAGGHVLNADGTKVSLAEGPTKKALQIMRDFSRSPSTPDNFATAREDDGRLEWEKGTAAFMTNYSFVWPSANGNAPAIAAQMRWARFPGVDADTPSKVAIGGFNLGVGGFSKHADLAAEAVSCLVGDDNQIVNATKGGLLPVTESLYDDKELTEATVEVTVDGKKKKVKAFPYADVIKAELKDAVVRPQTPYYNDVALAISRTLHPTRGIDPDKDVERLRKAITDALNGEGLL